MPILHRTYTGTLDLADGTKVDLHPGVILHQRGPVIQVTLQVADAIAQQLAQQGQVVPAPIQGEALIDTGASHTSIDDTVAQQLGLPVVNIATVATASQASSQQNVYPVRMEIVGVANHFDFLAIGGPLAVQGYVALIGRDMLQQCTLHYNGFIGEITLAF